MSSVNGRSSVLAMASAMAMAAWSGRTVFPYRCPPALPTVSGQRYYKGKPKRFNHKLRHNHAGSKLKKKAYAGVLGLCHPGGVISSTLREMARQRNLRLIAKKRRGNVARKAA